MRPMDIQQAGYVSQHQEVLSETVNELILGEGRFPKADQQLQQVVQKDPLGDGIVAAGRQGFHLHPPLHGILGGQLLQPSQHIGMRARPVQVAEVIPEASHPFQKPLVIPIPSAMEKEAQ